MNKIVALGALALSASLSLTLSAPAMAQTGAQIDRHDAMQVQTPGGTTVTRTVDHPDGSRTVVRRDVQRDMHRDDVGERTVVRRTVVRREVHNTGWHRHHRHCATRWHHHQRVTRCWTS